MEEGRSALKFLTDTPTEKKHPGRPRWKDNIRIVSIRGIGLIRLRVGIIGEP